jgi:mRNA interferase MazF
VIRRGDVFDADIPIAGRHPVVIVTREAAIPVLSSVAVVLVTSTIRGHRAEVPLTPEEGLDHDCVANCDQVFTLPKSRLERRRGRLGLPALARLNAALALALGLD